MIALRPADWQRLDRVPGKSRAAKIEALLDRRDECYTFTHEQLEELFTDIEIGRFSGFENLRLFLDNTVEGAALQVYP